MRRSMRQGQCAIVLAALIVASTAMGQSLPKRIAWRGTMIDGDGNVMELRTNVALGGDETGILYGGPLVCRGIGCRFNRGRIFAVVITNLQPYAYIDQVQFWGKLGQAQEYCVALATPRGGRPDLGIDGAAVCYLTPRHRRDGGLHYLRDGTISLRQSVD